MLQDTNKALEDRVDERTRQLRQTNEQLQAQIAERQQIEKDLREAQLQLESALVAGSVYTWRWNVITDRVVVNAAFAHLFGVNAAAATTEGLSIEFFLNSIHTEDRERVSAAIAQAIQTGEGYAG